MIGDRKLFLVMAIMIVLIALCVLIGTAWG